MKKLFLLAAVLLLSACGPQLEGTYSNGMLSLTFKADGKVNVSDFLGAVKVQFDYQVDGNEVKIISPQITQVFTLLDDGSIKGPLGMILKKQQY